MMRNCVLYKFNRNGSWGEGPHDVGGAAPWGDDKVSGSSGLTPWNDPSLTSWGGAQKPKNSMNPSWVGDGDVDPTAWGHPPKQVIFILFHNKELLLAMQTSITKPYFTQY